MRTTVDLPDDLHRIATSLARHNKRSLGQVVAELMRRGLDAPTAGAGGATVPSASGNVVQQVGVAISATAVNFERGVAVTLA